MPNRYKLIVAGLGLLALLPLLANGERPIAKKTESPWYEGAQARLAEAEALSDNRGRARRVILFVGDGMGISTVTAARILEGQLHGGTGEEHSLFFETLPYLALSKTYNTNQQTSDSAGTMTAMITGVKTKAGVLSVDETVVRGDHRSVVPVSTLLEEAEDRGLSTGIVSTARVTHATPGACYAHVPERNWEDDVSLPVAARVADFPDIARQLIEFHHGNGPEVVLGGGRRHFLPATVQDPEGGTGRRADGRDLTAEWKKNFEAAEVVFDQKSFDAVDSKKVGHLLGLFEPSHMRFSIDRGQDKLGEPSLAEMTRKAIEILERNRRGYFLHVEAGRIDHAHHATNAARALHDTIALAEAVKTAYELTDPKDTLIVVTADHSHVFTMAGYPTRGNPILGKVIGNGPDGAPLSSPDGDARGMPYTTLSYANGPGFVRGGRPDLGNIDTTADDYMQETMVPMPSETHGGEDVAIYASGPSAHLFHGVQEQHYIYHVMRHALRFDDPGWEGLLPR